MADQNTNSDRSADNSNKNTDKPATWEMRERRLPPRVRIESETIDMIRRVAGDPAEVERAQDSLAEAMPQTMAQVRKSEERARAEAERREQARIEHERQMEREMVLVSLARLHCGCETLLLMTLPQRAMP